MTRTTKRFLLIALSVLFLVSLPLSAAEEEGCVGCHRTLGPAMVMEWERSSHARNGVSCDDCHGAAEGEVDAWMHEGAWVSALVTPLDCSVSTRESAGNGPQESSLRPPKHAPNRGRRPSSRPLRT